MAQEQKLSTKSKKNFCCTLNKFLTFFGGILGWVHYEPIHIDSKEDSKPSKKRFYSVPKAYKVVTKREVNKKNV